MNNKIIMQRFLLKNWLFIEVQDKYILVDEEDDYISFISNQLFNKISFLLQFNNFHATLSLAGLVEQAKPT